MRALILAVKREPSEQKWAMGGLRGLSRPKHYLFCLRKLPVGLELIVSVNIRVLLSDDLQLSFSIVPAVAIANVLPLLV